MKRKNYLSLAASVMFAVMAGLTACSKIDDPVSPSSDEYNSYNDEYGDDNEMATALFIPGAVDLGLQSGALWADHNVGANSIEEDGLYFAWGETTGHRRMSTFPWNTEDGRKFDWASYQLFDGTKESLKSYVSEVNNVNASYKFVSPSYLEKNSDAAYKNMGGYWRMPRFPEVKELIEQCDGEFTIVNGKKGWKFTSRMNGNSIFLPASSDFLPSIDFDLNSYGHRGHYWTASVGNSEWIHKTEYNKTPYTDDTNAFCFNFHDKQDFGNGIGHEPKAWYDGVAPRCEGKTVRGVVPGHRVRAVDLGLPSGTKWATQNLGATKANSYVGAYFAYGETMGYSATYDDPEEYAKPVSFLYHFSNNYYQPVMAQYDGHVYNADNYKWMEKAGDEYKLTKYCSEASMGTVDGKTTLDPEDDAVRNTWGGKWRMPTTADFEELFIYTKKVIGTYNGVRGMWFYKKSGSNRIFIPFGGARETCNFNIYPNDRTSGRYEILIDGLIDFENAGFYRCSDGDGLIWLSTSLMFGSNAPTYEVESKDKMGPRYVGMLIRPVCNKSDDDAWWWIWE